MKPDSPRSWNASFVPETSRERIERLPRWWRIAVAGCLSVCLCAVLAANRSRGLMFPSLFVDAYGSFSAIDLPGLGTSQLPLRFPYELRAVDGAAVRCPESSPYRSLSCLSRVFERHRVGQLVQLRFDTLQARAVDVWRPMTAIGTREIMSLFITYCAVGLFVLWSGNMVFAYTARGPFTYASGALTSSRRLSRTARKVASFRYGSSSALPAFARSVSTTMPSGSSATRRSTERCGCPATSSSTAFFAPAAWSAAP